jgi:ubiquinone/menaquinone biosynthesis C-methylase UbiE
MNPIDVFSSKAEIYLKYRWNYTSELIRTILDVTNASPLSVVADIGAGPGTLSKRLARVVGRVYVVEPNHVMRNLAERELAVYPACQIVAGCAEATTLADHSVDLITVAQALNWFDPEPTRAEFLRILKKGGWLAILKYSGTDQEIGELVEKVMPKETDTGDLMKGIGVPASFYFGYDDIAIHRFPFTVVETWEEFLGGVTTTSYAPDQGTPWYPEFERQLRVIFDRFCIGSLIELHGYFELKIGQIATL